MEFEFFIEACLDSHLGVRRQTFFHGRAKNFPGVGGGGRTYLFPKNQQKRYNFPQKSLKTYYFRPPFPSPPDALEFTYQHFSFLEIFLKTFCQKMGHKDGN
jgi:hypothetical protein